MLVLSTSVYLPLNLNSTTLYDETFQYVPGISFAPFTISVLFVAIKVIKIPFLVERGGRNGIGVGEIFPRNIPAAILMIAALSEISGLGVRCCSTTVIVCS